MSEVTASTLSVLSRFSADSLTDVLRSGAHQLIEQAIETEVNALLSAYADETTRDGLARLTGLIETQEALVKGVIQ